MFLVWIILLATVSILLLLDLGLLYRRSSQISFIEALALSGFWIVIGLAFALFIYFVYEQAWFSQYLPVTALDGKQAVTQYLTTYLLEKALSLDNLFVIAVIFDSLAVPVSYQYRVLLYGILGAILLRVLIIVAGTQLLAHFSWMNFVFAAVLLFAAIRFFVNHSSIKQRNENRLTRLISRFIPVGKSIDGDHFFQRTEKGLMLTPLFIAMILIESTDLLYALDSIPAALAISQDPFIVVSSNIFALLGLRALYFVMASAMQQLHYLKVSMIVILLFVAVKMLLLHSYPISADISFPFISIVIVAGIVASLLQKEHGPVFATSPLVAEVGRIYYLTFASLRRIIVLVIGISVVIVGIIMIVTPGPAIVVIPAGLAILASEFVWARIILKKFKRKFVHYSKETMYFFSRNKQNKQNKPSDKDTP